MKLLSVGLLEYESGFYSAVVSLSTVEVEAVYRRAGSI